MLISLMLYGGGNAAGSNGFPVVGVIVVAVLVAVFAIRAVIRTRAKKRWHRRIASRTDPVF